MEKKGKENKDGSVAVCETVGESDGLEELRRKNAEMTEFKNRLIADLSKMGVMMTAKDGVISKQTDQLKKLANRVENNNYRNEVNRLQQQVDDQEMLLRRGKDELENKAKIIKGLNDELVSSKNYLEEILKNHEISIAELKEEDEREKEELKKMNIELKKQAEDQANIIRTCKNDLSFFMNENTKLKNNIKAMKAKEESKSDTKKTRKAVVEDPLQETMLNQQSLIDLKLEVENFQVYICEKLDALNTALLPVDDDDDESRVSCDTVSECSILECLND